jgi:fucose 4-O-acetylase-like acetyltransferase
MNIQDSYFDNLKFVLILIVVFADFFVINNWSELVDGVAFFLNSFHIAGWFLHVIFLENRISYNFLKTQ